MVRGPYIEPLFDLLQVCAVRARLSLTFALPHMEYFTLPYYYHFGLCLFLSILFHGVLRATAKQPRLRLPPGPWQLPIIGSLHHLLRGLPHRTMRDLSLRHGPLMMLRVCERVAIVVSSAEAAREIYRGNEAAFSERLTSPGIDELYRHGQGIVFAPYGDHWRLLRRILMMELLSARRVEAFRRIREEEAARLVSTIQATSSPSDGRLVNIDERLDEFMTDSAVRAIFGDRLPDRGAFLKIVKQGVGLSSLFDLRDLFPSSRLARLLPRSGKAERQRQETFRLMDNILKTREERRMGREGDDEQDMVDVLLRIQKQGNTRVSLSDGVIRALLTDVFAAALDTTTTILQWAMAELMINPRVMRRVQSEADYVLAGHATRPCDYTLLPRSSLECVQDCKIQGYDVPRGATMLTNTWAISRDPKYWNEPEKFMPERFECDGVADFRGLDFEFTPFGVGRRICPGIDFAYANIEIALASLIYHFDWELPPRVDPKEIDMTEVFGATVRRKAELFLRPIPRVPL
ncbi:LOW QUALITY PROTEIN: desmethyl-deoxy-podophyllotoxin synthase [Aegilops tauschii subsp. strangulata]|uniref:LOW QUALITY PROTEIN: desmethyl-deoxy-podophyllotoxin synthase n=1 Tax=Aegilops tauschii subsp. strangulata TaxID=200361 RepID=UPI003CC8C9C0